MSGKVAAKDAVKADLPKLYGRYYPAEDRKTKITNHAVRNPTKLKKNITPGTVLIIVNGRFSGKRVVFLKQLASGLLLVNGPFQINGVPLRRINQIYTIATSTKVDVSGVDVKSIDDNLFIKSEKKSAKKKDEFFGTEKVCWCFLG